MGRGGSHQHQPAPWVSSRKPLVQGPQRISLIALFSARAIAVSDRRVGRQYLAKEFSHEVDPSEDSVDWFIDHDTVPSLLFILNDHWWIGKFSAE